MTTPNREFKDSLFTDYFSDKERLIEAYNAIAGTDFPPTAKVEFKTLKSVLVRSQSNDIAFMLEDRFIVMIEHQSTINENMPLRLLIYIAEEYKDLVNEDSLYSRKTVPIPTPEFIVIYNGMEKYPDKKELRLSDAFMALSGSPGLELTTTVYNINKGHNLKMLEQSTALSDYSEFITHVKDRLADGDTLGEAIDKAIHYCINNGIMLVYLKKDSAEVKRMLTMEWNEEVYRKVLIEEGREEGRVEGREEGRVEGESIGAAQAKLETARSLKEEGISDDIIARVTGLSEEEIAGL